MIHGSKYDFEEASKQMKVLFELLRRDQVNRGDSKLGKSVEQDKVKYGEYTELCHDFVCIGDDHDSIVKHTLHCVTPSKAHRHRSR